MRKICLALVLTCLFSFSQSPGALGSPQITVDISGGSLWRAVDDQRQATVWRFEVIDGEADCGPDFNWSRAFFYEEDSPIFLASDWRNKALCLTSTLDGSQATTSYFKTPTIAQVSPRPPVTLSNTALQIWDQSKAWRLDRSNDTLCQTADFTDKVPLSNPIIPLVEADNGQTFCLLAQNAGLDAVISQLVIGIDQTPPSLTFSLDDYNLKAQANEPIRQWWYWQDQSDCGPALSFETASLGQTIKLPELSVDTTFCFGAQDWTGNWGWQAKTILAAQTRRGPEITITQNNLEVRAQADQEVVAWQHLVLDQTDSCDSQTDFSQALDGDSLTLNNQVPDQIICFRAQDISGDWGYGFDRLKVLNPGDPIIIVAYNQGNLIATSGSGQLTGWQYKVIEPNDQCDQTTFESGARAGRSVPISQADDGQVYCFRAADQAGRFGYARYRLNLTPPTIFLQVSAGVLQAQGNGQVVRWDYLTTTQPTDCLAGLLDFSQATSADALALKLSDKGQTYCFRATNSQGQKSYQTYLVTADDVAHLEAVQAPLKDSLPWYKRGKLFDLVLGAALILAGLVQLLLYWLIIARATKKGHVWPRWRNRGQKKEGEPTRKQPDQLNNGSKLDQDLGSKKDKPQQ